VAAYPPLVTYATEAEYRTHYEQSYCQGPLLTHDGISVRFRKGNFDHIFFESSQRNATKDVFSQPRAERIDWIACVLQDASLPMYQGWDKKKKRYDPRRRVVIAQGNYVVVIHMARPGCANHVTAYMADAWTVGKILSGPIWT